MSVAIEPGPAVEPFGRIIPDEPGSALIELLPTTAKTTADVGTGIEGVCNEGVVTRGVDWLLDVSVIVLVGGCSVNGLMFIVDCGLAEDSS